MTEDSKQDLVSIGKGAQSQGFQINLVRKSTLSSFFDVKVHMYHYTWLAGSSKWE